MPGRIRRLTAIAARERNVKEPLGTRQVTAAFGTRKGGWRLLAVTVAVVLASVMSVTVVKVPAAHASCGNPVACENALPGTPKSQWDVAKGEGTTIQGFADPFSVNVGQTISFKIQSPATAYAIDIYRMGYYGGYGARLEASITPNIAVSQSNQPSACDGNTATGLVDCGTWGVSATWDVPATAVSGVYFAHIHRTDGSSDENQIPFVVTNNASHSDVVFMTSDETWQAYNDWGGYSLYTGTATDTPHSSIDSGRAVQVSYNRPFASRFDTPFGQDFFYYAEFPMVQFLEKNGYDVSYVSQQDVAASNGASMLEQHKVFVNAGHSEYFDAGDRANLTAARDAGVSLAFFTGNTMWWKTRWAASTYGNEPNRTLITYKESLDSAQTDPADPPTWTGAWRDPRFSTSGDDGGQPENALTGQLWLVNCCSYAMQVPAAYAKLRFWRNTSVASLQPGQTATMPGETLGYEWDSDVDNGFRPPGEIDMSKTTESVSQLLLTPNEQLGMGNATHNLTLYRAASGALVFDAGTVQWAWGLESDHDGDARHSPSPAMQQATANLLADMGAQPATLEADLAPATASTDSTPPASAITSPSAGASFSNGSAVTISGTATDSGGVVAGVEVSTDGGSSWHEATTMSPADQNVNWSYTWSAAASGPVTIMSRATDDSGNIGSPGPGVAVTVNCPCGLFGNNYAPAVTSANDSSKLELGMKFQTAVPGWVAGVRFYQGTGNTGTHTGSLWTSAGALLATGTFTNETGSGWQTMMFASPVQISANTTYVVSYYDPTGHYAADTDLLDWPLNTPPLTAPRSVYTPGGSGNGVFNVGGHAFPRSTFHGNSYGVDVIFNTAQSSGAPPAVSGVTPYPGSSSNPVSVTPTVTFSKPMMPSTASFTVTDANGNTVPGTTNFDGTNTTATFTPANSLAAGSTYTATISGAQDTFGQPMTPTSYTYTFQTGTVRTPGQCPCSVWPDLQPQAASDAADGAAVQLGMKFQAANSGTISGIRFYKEPDNTGTHTGSLWTSTGTLLATGTFTGESSTGWEELDFPTPVAITAGTTYVASYFASAGHYAVTLGGLSAAVTSGPLTVLANGVYLYGSNAAFPSRSSTSNYWVDVVYTPTADPVAPSVTATNPLNGQTSVSTGTAVTFTFSKAVQPSTIGFTLTDPGGISVPGTLTYNSSTKSATFVPTSTLVGTPALSAGTTYTATVSGAQNIAGTAMPSPYTWSFSTAPATPPPGQCPCSIWPATAQPSVASANDASSVNVGVKFTSDTSGSITGIRFYKGAANTGTHIGSLWSSTGTLLSQVTFTGESTAGWQQANFPAPIAVTAGTTYVASYLAPHGGYSVNSNGFSNAGVDNPPLHALQSAANNGNGVYLYKSSSAFPNATFKASNYWVDVVFTTTASGARRPAAVLGSPAAAAGTTAPSGPAATAGTTGTTAPGGPAAPSRAASRPAFSPRLARALTGWNAGRGGTALAAVTTAVGDATQAAGLRFYAEMRQACGQVATAVAAARPSAPIPDPALQHRYASALAKFAKAATNCRAGVSVHTHGDEDVETHENQRMLRRSMSEFVAGGTELYRATASIEALARSRRH